LTKPDKKASVAKKMAPDDDVDEKGPRRRFRPDRRVGDGPGAPRAPRPKPEQEYRQVSAAPVEAPTFRNTGLNAEVEELLGQITPNAEADLVVKKLVRVVKQTISQMIPEAEVTGFASGNPTRSKAFGVAVPDIDIVINASPAVLAQRLQGRLTRGGMNAARLDPRKLQKAAIRACTDELTSSGGLKFRRSAFRGEDPKVTLLAPSSLTGAEVALPMDVSVNSATPLHSAALLTECGQFDLRAKELILLVRRWARDRGVCHAAKGNLPPYAWSLLSIYFLQVGDDAAALLPPLKYFAKSSELAGKPSREAMPAKHTWSPSQGSEPKKSVAALFREFVDFYHSRFDWRREAVSVRRACRGAPDLALQLHIVERADGSATEVAPSIEDPFEAKRNISTCMTALGVQRMREELARAHEFFSRDGSLSELLGPWAPPEREEVAVGVDEDAEA
jgi:DNA polymerase sigma